MSFWQLAEEIEVVESATNYPVVTNMVNALCSGFTNQFGNDWSWNTFNDDLMWASVCFSRAYLLTGNTTYRTLAQNGFDLAYRRGWDPTDGGIFQDTSDSNPKCTCGNGSGADAAYLLYQTLNNTNYLAKAQGIYGWMVTNVFDPTTGAVMEGPGTGNYFTYDSGTFATIALWLGATNYANKAGDWVTNHWGVAMQSFGSGSDGGGMNGICLRGLARTGHNIPFLQAACENAWSWQNVRGLTPTDWTERGADTNVLYSYDCCSQVAGMLCVPPGVPPTLPVTAADVVGSQVTFSAAFGGGNSYLGLPTNYYGVTFTAAIGAGNTYQWQLIRGGMTNNIPGATNTTLTLLNLQLTNTASYQLKASNALGISVSLPSSLTVSNVSAAVNKVVASYAAQTGRGYGFGLTPTWTVAPGSVIAGQFPSSTNGDFDLEPYWGDRNVNSLTAGNGLTVCPGGSPTTTITSYVTCGNGTGPNSGGSNSAAGSLVIYTLTNSSAGGYNLTNITVYGGWKDAGRDQQAYTVYYSKVSAPTTFILLGSVNYTPVNAASVSCATRATLTPATGALATNVAAVKFDFTTPASENGYCGYAQIALYGTPLVPVVATNTLPVTAADVVGSQVTFTAAFTAASPPAYQWQMISGGVTNNIPGATNTTLTLANLQLTNTASYQLQASNAYGVAVSAPGSLTVSSVPSPVNNVITAYAAQTGFGPTGVIGSFFTPTWTITTNNSLIAGQSPSSASGNFTEEIPGRNVNSLTAGGSATITVINGTYGYTTSTNYVTCGNGSGAGASIIYTLSGSTNGYNLTNLTVYGGWGDAGRDQQAYTVYYSTIAAPTNFVQLDTVNYNPANAANVQSATRATLTPAAGMLATNVAAVKFDFTTPTTANGYCGYWEIDLFGIPVQVTVPPATNPTNMTFQVAAGGLVLNWPADHIGWQLQAQTNDLNKGIGSNWFNVAGSTLTNQISFPINSGNGAVFFRLFYQ